MIRRLLPLCLFLAPLLALGADGEAKTGFLDRVFKEGDKESKYVLFVPEGYDPEKTYPLILFLHGLGESGNDGKRQVTVGLGKAVKERQKTFPAFVIFPQSQKKNWTAGSEDGKRAMAILDEVSKEYKIDSKRVYLTGLSMGGFGSWSLVAAYPERWAAVVPICGRGDPKTASKFKDVPLWAFHGDKDPTVPVAGSRTMIDALKKAGGEPKYTEYEGVGHNSWDKAYATDELYDWMFKQTRK
jgi:predicted peptidase